MNFTQFLESKKPLPMGKMVLKAMSKDMKAQKEPDIKKKTKLEDQARVLQMTASEQIEYLLSDPLEDLYHLVEDEMGLMDKPQMQDELSGEYASPNEGNYEHPVTQQKKQVNDMIKQGTNAIEAHQSVHGEVNLGDVESKAKFASTLGRIQDEGSKNGVKLQPEKGSILSKDASMEKETDQVTRDDLRTPMNQQVPDQEQTPQDQVAEELENNDEYDYNEDVAYLQQFGRA